MSKTHMKQQQGRPRKQFYRVPIWRMKIRQALVLLICCFVFPLNAAAAHDFWLHPELFQISGSQKAPTKILIRLQTGHPGDSSPWPLAPERIVSVRTIGPNGVVDQQAGVTPSPSGFGALNVTVKEPGIHIVAFESRAARSELQPAAFNAYLNEEGLGHIQKIRSKLGTDNKPGREYFSRRSKALIRVGQSTDNSAHILKPLGFTLEIVPSQIFYELQEGAPMGFKIFYRGQPIPGVKVVMTQLDDRSKTPIESISNAMGNVRFERPSAGEYFVHAVWSSPSGLRADAEFDTIFSSLSFAL